MASLVGPIPGGVGVADASLGALLIANGVAGPTAAAAVLAFRLLDLWLPLLVGAVAGARQYRRNRASAADAVVLEPRSPFPPSRPVGVTDAQGAPTSSASSRSRSPAPACAATPAPARRRRRSPSTTWRDRPPVVRADGETSRLADQDVLHLGVERRRDSRGMSFPTVDRPERELVPREELSRYECGHRRHEHADPREPCRAACARTSTDDQQDERDERQQQRGEAVSGAPSATRWVAPCGSTRR